MNPHDPRASLDADTIRCRYCTEEFQRAPGVRTQYCSDECRKAAASIRESLRQKDLRAHGLCPRCKHPL